MDDKQLVEVIKILLNLKKDDSNEHALYVFGQLLKNSPDRLWIPQSPSITYPPPTTFYSTCT